MLVGCNLKVFIGLIGLFLVDDDHELTILRTTVLNPLQSLNNKQLFR